MGGKAGGGGSLYQSNEGICVNVLEFKHFMSPSSGTLFRAISETGNLFFHILIVSLFVCVLSEAHSPFSLTDFFFFFFLPLAKGLLRVHHASFLGVISRIMHCN